MDVRHAKLVMWVIASLIFFTQGELIPIIGEESENLVHDYGVTGVIQGVSGEDENSNQHGWALEKVRVLLGMQKRVLLLGGEASAAAPSPHAEPPSYHIGHDNNDNNNNHMPFTPLGPSMTTPTPPDQSSTPAFNFNAPYPEEKKKTNGKLKVIVISVLLTAAVTLALGGLVLYLHWKCFGNGHALEEQPRSERGLLNSSISEGSDYFKALHAAELGVLSDGTYLASFGRDKFENVSPPTCVKNDDPIRREVQAMSLSTKPTSFPSLESLSDGDSFHSICESPSSDSNRPSLPSWDLPSSHSSPVSSPSFPVKPFSSIAEGGVISPLPTKRHPSKSPPQLFLSRSSPSPPRLSAGPSSPAKALGIRDIAGSQEATQPCASTKDSQPSRPPLPPRPPPLFSRDGQSSNLGVGKSVPQFSGAERDGSQVSRPKLKPLYWDKVRAPPDRTTVWNRLRSGSFEFDEEMIQSLFGCNTTNVAKCEATISSVVPPPARTQTILEPRKSQNIAIILRALNVTREAVCDALMQGEGLTTEQLEMLVKMTPTREEEDRLKDYNGDISKLGPAEHFIKALLDIPFAFRRVDAMLYRATFEEEFINIQKSLETLELACKELRCSRLFLKLLEAVLKTGNRLNVGTFRGEAQAFKLDALLKLADIKGIDGKTTLLHFVVQEIMRAEGMQSAEASNGLNDKSVGDKEEDYRKLGLQLISGLSTELCNVKKAAGIDSSDLISSFSNLSLGLDKIGHFKETESHRERMNEETIQSITQGSFNQFMASFLQKAEEKIDQLQKEEKRVFSLVRDITEYFHGNSAKEEAHPLRIFVIVRDFLGMLDHVCKELGRMKKNSQASSQKGPSMRSTHNSSHSLFPAGSKPDSSRGESTSSLHLHL